jgi:hypothetical protein
MKKNQYSVYASCFLLAICMSAPKLAAAECGPNLGCDELNKCGAFETFRIPYSTITRCIEEGQPPPKEWLRKGGHGINYGGKGNLVRGDLESPFVPTPATDALLGADSSGAGANNRDSDSGLSGLLNGLFNGGGGGSSGGSGGSKGSGGNQSEQQSVFPAGPATETPPNCDTYKSPFLLRACDVRGERVNFAQAAENICGSSIAAGHEFAIFTRDANKAAITVPATNELQIFTKNLSSLSYQSKVQIPKFFCVIEGQTIRKIPISSAQYYADISSRTKTLPIKVYTHNDQGKQALEERYIVMRRDNNNAFKPPKPNPEYFFSQMTALQQAGVSGSTKGPVIDPECYSFDHLFESEIPDGFGDVFVGNMNANSCQSKMIRPQGFLSESDPGNCDPFQQFYDGYTPTIIAPPSARAERYGRIQGGTPYSRSTVQFAQGGISTKKSGAKFYTGMMLTIPNAELYLSGSVGGTNKQHFPAGAFFTINEKRFLHVSPPGRIELSISNDGNTLMKLIDGGIVEDDTGLLIREMTPKSSISFGKKTVISGSANSTMAPPIGAILPTNAASEAILPYDSRLDLICENYAPE